jgi:hypothetical protein
MNPRQIFILGSGGLFVLSLMVACIAFRSVRQANTALAAASAQASSMAATLRRLGSRILDSRREYDRQRALLGGLRSRLGAWAPKTTPPDVAAIEWAVHSIPRKTWADRVLAKDPKLQALYLASERASLQQRYGAFWQQLGLSAEQIGRFGAIMMEETERMLDLTATAQSQGLDGLDPSITTLRRQAEDQLAAAQLELLGDSGYGQLHEFERAMPMHGFVDAFAGSVAIAGAPIGAAEAGQLTQIMANTNPGYQAGGTADDPTVHSFDEPIMAQTPVSEAVDPDAVLVQARSVLSEEQYAAFAAQIERNHDVIQVFNALLQAPGEPISGFAMGRR